MRIFGTNGQEMLACGSKKGKLLVYRLSNGTLIGEVESAHYLAIEDLDVSKTS